MAGLLDSFFGNADQTQALGLLGAGLMAGNAPQGFMAAQGLLADAPRRRMQEQLMQAQIAETMAQAEERKTLAAQRQAEAARLAGIQQGLPNVFRQPGFTGGAPVPQTFGGSDVPMFSKPMGVSPMQATPGGFDVQEALRLRMKPEEITAYAGLSNIGRPKVARTVEVDDGKGGKATMQLDDFGQPVGSALPSYIAPTQVDRGGSVDFVRPVAGLSVGKTGNPFSDLLLSDGQGGMRTNAPLVGAKRSIAAAGAPQVNVNTDKSYFGNVAEGMAKNDVALIDAARSAPDRIASALRVKEILSKNPITGTGAEARLSVHRALATAGLVDAKDVANTEVLASTLASQTLDAIKSSGLGSGQGFTDKDRAFLERAKSGNIEMNSTTLYTLADLNERAARATIQRGNVVIDKLRKSPQAGSMGQQLDLVQEPKPPSVVRKPAGAPPSGGKVRFLGFE